MIQQYQLKVNPITLFHYTGDNKAEMELWAGRSFNPPESYSNAPENSIMITTKRGYSLTLSPGCYLEKLPDNQFEIYHQSKLDQYYELVPVPANDPPA